MSKTLIHTEHVYHHVTLYVSNHHVSLLQLGRPMAAPILFLISTSGMLCSSDIYICDVHSENVSQRSISTLWEMQNKQFVKILMLFFYSSIQLSIVR